MPTRIKREFPVDPSSLLPAVTPDNERFWQGLAEGELLLQACTGCGRVRHPIAPVCPYIVRVRRGRGASSRVQARFSASFVITAVICPNSPT